MNRFTYVQLGWLQSAINYVYNHILSPLFDKIFGIIGDIQRTLFQKLLLPILETVFGVQIELFKALFLNFIYNLLFRITRVVMWMLDAIENAFRTFAGLNPVYVLNDAGKTEETGSLLFAIISGNTFRVALMGMIAASFALCFLTAIFATIKAIGDFGGDDGRSKSVGKVMRLTGSALLRLIMIPLMALFFVVLGDAILKSVYIATNSDRAQVSDIIFTMSTLDAVRDDVPDGDADYYNSSTRAAALARKGAKSAAEVADYGLKDKYRKDYYLGGTVDGIMGEIESVLDVGHTKKRTVMHEVLETFDIRRIDYFIAIGLTVLFIYLFGSMAIAMIARIFDCLLLLLVEPFFAASIPLDDGEKFKNWQDLFLGRLISGYGMIVGMNLYLMVTGMIFEGKVAFFGEGTTPAVDYLVRIMFVLAGAYAITQAGPLVTGIMNYQAGTREGEMLTQGANLTKGIANAVTWPARKIASYYWNRGVNQATQLARNAFASSLANGGSATPGKGDGFGQPGGRGKGPEGVQFNGKKEDGPSGSTGSGGHGPEGVQFDGKKGGQGAAVFRLGSGDDDGFETVFDVGGKSLFDEDSGDELQGLFGGEKKDDQLFTGRDKQNSFANPSGGLDEPKQGLPAPYDFLQAGNLQQPSTEGTYGFLNAGNAVDEKFNYIGERDKKEREEKKKFEEQLGAAIEDETLSAAESETGMDLNGDGIVGSGINGVDGADLTMNDILGTHDPIDDMKKDPLADLNKDPFADRNNEFRAKPGSMEDILDLHDPLKEMKRDPLADLKKDPAAEFNNEPMAGFYNNQADAVNEGPFKKEYETLAEQLDAAVKAENGGNNPFSNDDDNIFAPGSLNDYDDDDDQ